MPRTSVARRKVVRDMGTSLLFGAASTDRVDCGTDFIGAAAGSITAWIKPRHVGGGGNGRILDNGKVVFLVTGTGKLSRLSGLTTGSGGVLGADNVLAQNTLYFVAMTWTAAGAVNLYINGVLTGAADQAAGAVVAGSTNLILGNRNAQDRGFSGWIDEVRVYNTVLTANQLLDLMYSNIVPSGCTAEYLFNEESGSTATDSVGGHTGTITGATYSETLLT